MNPSIIDKFVAVFSAGAAAKRMLGKAQFNAISSYTGASRTRRELKGFNPSLGSADSDVIYDRPTLIARSSSLIRNSSIAAGAAKILSTSVIGPGLHVQSRISPERAKMTVEEAKRTERDLEFHFNKWAASVECDASRKRNFYQLQLAAFDSAFERGDCFALLPMFKRAGSPYGLKIQLLEGDRVCNPAYQSDSQKMTAGIEHDDNGAVSAYYITSSHPYQYMRSKQLTWKRIPAFGKNTGRKNVIHVMRAGRIGQTRGVPELSPVILELAQLAKYTEAELQSAILSSIFSVAIVSNNPDGVMGEFEGAGVQPIDGTGDYKLGTGNVFRLDPDEDIRTINTGKPNPEFGLFTEQIIKQIGMALEIPYEILLRSFSISYSASQAAMLEAWRVFDARREWFAQTFCQDVYASFVGELVASGKVQVNGFFTDDNIRHAVTSSVWIGRPRGHIREDNAIKASVLAINEGLTTRTAEVAKLFARDWEEMQLETQHENLIMAKAEAEILKVAAQHEKERNNILEAKNG